MKRLNKGDAEEKWRRGGRGGVCVCEREQVGCRHFEWLSWLSTADLELRRTVDDDPNLNRKAITLTSFLFNLAARPLSQYDALTLTL